MRKHQAYTLEGHLSTRVFKQGLKTPIFGYLNALLKSKLLHQEPVLSAETAPVQSALKKAVYCSQETTDNRFFGNATRLWQDCTRQQKSAGRASTSRVSVGAARTRQVSGGTGPAAAWCPDTSHAVHLRIFTHIRDVQHGEGILEPGLLLLWQGLRLEGTDLSVLDDEVLLALHCLDGVRHEVWSQNLLAFQYVGSSLKEGPSSSPQNSTALL